MKTKTLTTILVAGLLTGSLAMAGGHKGNSGHKGFSPIYKDLNLTDDQESEIRAIFKESKDTYKTSKTERKADREQLDALVQADTFDEAAVNEIATKRAESFKEKFNAMAKARHEAWNVLTDEQKAEVIQLKAEKEAKREERRQKREDGEES